MKMKMKMKMKKIPLKPKIKENFQFSQQKAKLKKIYSAKFKINLKALSNYLKKRISNGSKYSKRV